MHENHRKTKTIATYGHWLPYYNFTRVLECNKLNKEGLKYFELESKFYTACLNFP